MTCGWCGGSIASANKPHMKGQCEMGNWEAEKCEYPECNRKKWTGMYCSEHYKERWPRTYAQLIKERDNQGQSLQAKYDALEQAARGLVEYRDHNVLNWQLEKADDFINAMRRLLDGVNDECTCTSCEGCGGTGHVWYSFSGEYLGNSRCDDMDELEVCDDCGGSGIFDVCDHCRVLEEMDGDK